MAVAQKKLRFDLSGYYLMGLIVLILLGFWPSYFSKFLYRTANFSNYFHFHATILIVWIVLLIVQPILIRKKKIKIHRWIGIGSYLIIPLIFLSIILLTHFRTPKGNLIKESDLEGAFNSFKDIVILCVAFFIAIKYRKDYQLHARGMIVTGLAFIEPSFIRFNLRIITDTRVAYLFTIGILYAVFIFLIYKERNQKSARWVFPLALVLYMMAHTFVLMGVDISVWRNFITWFSSLPLTS
jgi:hypothetical protein